MLAGLCIGAAEIGYFYLFGTFVYAKSIPANIVIPTVVSGTVVITLLVSYFIFGELMPPIRLFGAILAIVGIVMSLPTVGPLMRSSLMSQDMFLAGSMLMVLSMLGVLGTLVSDLLLLWIDPRIRFGSGER